jgi:DNA-binding MarR family transcriptional regulator
VTKRKPPRSRKKNGRDSGRLPTEQIDLGAVAQLAGTYLRMFSLEMNSGVNEIMKDHPIGPGQGKTSTLQVIVRNPGISQIELSDIFGRDRSAQFRIIQTLETQGFVRRETDPGERRRHMLFATPAGKALVAGLEKMARDNDARVFRALTPSEYAEFRRLLAKLWRSTLRAGSHYWPDFPAAKST